MRRSVEAVADQRYRAAEVLRPATAPRSKFRAATDIRTGNSGPAFPAPDIQYLSSGDRLAARQRVEESRKVKESAFWGREPAKQRDLPAFWSTKAHGEPFNDPRLCVGSAAHYKTVEPTPLSVKEPKPSGPASEHVAFLRQSLKQGMRLYDPKTLEPNHAAVGASQPALKLRNEEREMLVTKLPPHQRLYALQDHLNADQSAPGFMPWVWFVDTAEQGLWKGRKDVCTAAWKRDKDMCIRLAVQCVERKMRRHLSYISRRECSKACAPFALTKDILKRAFWQVDPNKTGDVSLQQFMQLWQNVLKLCEHSEAPQTSLIASQPGSPTKSGIKLVPDASKPVIVDRNVAAAVFVKYGFDVAGFLPYAVFINTLTSKPARLLGHEILIDQTKLGKSGKNGLYSDTDVAIACGDAKVKYMMCKSPVFPPSGFDPRVAYRSRMAPRAHMYLEYVHGYAGVDNLSNNLFYTKNATKDFTECVYYVGMVGVVYSSDAQTPEQAKATTKQPRNHKQRFFFGHDNDIQCMAIHPTRKWVATGQQKATGKHSRPYVCVWDVDKMEQWQRLDHDVEERAVIACTFSGNINGDNETAQGGDLLVTVTGDNQHTIHVWRWWNREKKFLRGRCIPGWHYGPEKKLTALRSQSMFYDPKQHHSEKYAEQRNYKDTVPDTSSDDEEWKDNAKIDVKDHAVYKEIMNLQAEPVDAAGFCVNYTPGAMWWPDSALKLDSMPGLQGTPPVVYGVAWNPNRPSKYERGAEFLSYGVRHLKTWIMDDRGTWICKSASFGPQNVENVLSAVYLKARHLRAAPGDSVIVTGFSRGTLGLWVPPYPTRAGAVYALTRIMEAHDHGPLVTLPDGAQVYGGVRVMRVRKNGTVITGGSDGKVLTWDVLPPSTTPRRDGTPRKGVLLERTSHEEFTLATNGTPLEGLLPAAVRGLDCCPAKEDEFIAGTDGCDIWEVDRTPETLVDGHTLDVYHVATHPVNCADLRDYYVTAAECGGVFVWNTKTRRLERTAAMGFRARSVAISEDRIGGDHGVGGNFHIAIGGKAGRVMVVDFTTLQPLFNLHDARQTIGDMKYSPKQHPGKAVDDTMLACACNDMRVHVYNASRGYQRVSVCVGHSGSITQLDWSLPCDAPLSLKGKCLLMTNDAAREILHWNPETGRKVSVNQRDTVWNSWTAIFGFDAMGIWPDGKDRSEINNVCRSRRGRPKMNQDNRSYRKAAASDNYSCDDIPGAGFIVTADDSSSVRIFNYPCVWDDAPYRSYRGHASHVMCVRFTADDRRVVSVGGHDRAVFQWRTVGVNRHDAAADDIVLAELEPDKVITELRQHVDTKVPKTGTVADWAEVAPGKFASRVDVEKMDIRRQSDVHVPLKSVNSKPMALVDETGSKARRSTNQGPAEPGHLSKSYSSKRHTKEFFVEASREAAAVEALGPPSSAPRQEEELSMAQLESLQASAAPNAPLFAPDTLQADRMAVEAVQEVEDGVEYGASPEVAAAEAAQGWTDSDSLQTSSSISQEV